MKISVNRQKLRVYPIAKPRLRYDLLCVEWDELHTRSPIGKGQK